MQSVACHLQYIGQRLGILAQQLFQIAGTTRHRVIQQNILAARPALSPRFVLRRNAQVIHLAAKTLLQTQLQSRNKRLNHLIVDARLCVGHQNTQCFRAKFAIQVQALNDA